jgi:type IV secretory pathway VirB4 component
VLALKIFRDKAAGVADLLNWSHLVDSGIVLCKDGSLLAGWFYRAPDIASSTDSERNWLSGRVSAALARLGAGWAPGLCPALRVRRDLTDRRVQPRR